MSKRALITGIGGQDGFFLAELLLGKGYEVYGISNIPLATIFSTDSLVYFQIKVYLGDLLDQAFVKKVLEEVHPDEIYHFAAQSNVGASYSCSQETYRVNTVGSLQLFELANEIAPKSRIYFAGSSEMFGNAPSSPQDEATPFRPKSPYGMSKVAAYYSAKFHRDACGQFIAMGITYNHESERRPLAFVTQKICNGLVNAEKGSEHPLVLGNLDSIRDWGFAGDYVEAMWKLLQYKEPVDVIIATGVGHTVEAFVNSTAHSLGYVLEWEGKDLDRIARDSVTSKIMVNVSKEFYRVNEEVPLVGNSAYLHRITEWTPRLSFEQLVHRMVKYAVAASSEAV